MDATRGEPARLIHDSRVRVLNCSATGCLLETTHPVPVDTVAALQVSFGGRPFEDVVQVVRCETMSESGNLYHVAARFLAVAPPYEGSLRHLMRYQIEEIEGHLSNPEKE